MTIAMKTTANVVSSTSTACESDWSDIHVVTTPLGWWDALHYCRSNYNNLFSIPDSRTQDLVANSIRNASVPGNGVWIGLRRHRWWGYLYWTDGEPLGYMNWGDGEPSDPINNLCTQISRDRNFSWSDQCCAMKQSFVCN
ncbi:lithostathine-1-beta-like [Hyperolius riggenbachi]|uniref:lithostathine-1-beta-like n=1 Tax=Hyperolius riggenbachi TaxID=752182 RepID=UPI0035A3C1A4